MMTSFFFLNNVLTGIYSSSPLCSILSYFHSLLPHSQPTISPIFTLFCPTPNLPYCRVSNSLKLITFLFWTLSAEAINKITHNPWAPSISDVREILLIAKELSWQRRENRDQASTWDWIFWMPVKCSYQLSHWSSGIGAGVVCTFWGDSILSI